MRLALALALITVLADMPGPPPPAIRYFALTREVHVSDPGKQNYFVIDEEIWRHSRSDLGDLRLYDGQSPVQYALSEQREGVASDEVDVKILNLGTVSGHTEFDLDMQGTAEYNRIRLRLDAHDFVGTASISGGDGPGRAASVELPASTVYDFSKERLGSNSLLKLPSSNFRFLHVKISAGVRPQDVKSAGVYQQHDQQASWTPIGSCAAPQQKDRGTIVICNLPDHLPVSQIAFEVVASQVNFRRSVTVDDGKGVRLGTGDISRVRISRQGTLFTDEHLAVPLAGVSGPVTVTIDNGDNPALAIERVQPQVTEHRVYFDPNGRTGLKLYYGDEKLAPPVYDYARFFRAEAQPAVAGLGPDSPNPFHQPRPDERPWSERHKAVLWGAMLVTVLALSYVAVRSLRVTTVG